MIVNQGCHVILVGVLGIPDHYSLLEKQWLVNSGNVENTVSQFGVSHIELDFGVRMDFLPLGRIITVLVDKGLTVFFMLCI